MRMRVSASNVEQRPQELFVIDSGSIGEPGTDATTCRSLQRRHGFQRCSSYQRIGVLEILLQSVDGHRREVAILATKLTQIHVNQLLLPEISRLDGLKTCDPKLRSIRRDRRVCRTFNMSGNSADTSTPAIMLTTTSRTASNCLFRSPSALLKSLSVIVWLRI
jgi:hypothetical protein